MTLSEEPLVEVQPVAEAEISMKPEQKVNELIIGQVITETVGGVVRVDLSPVELTDNDRTLHAARKRRVKVGLLFL